MRSGRPWSCRRPRSRSAHARHCPVRVRLDLVVRVSPAVHRDPVHADDRHVQVERLSAASANGPTSSYDSARATPPVTTSFRFGRTASSDAMLSELVTTVSRVRSDSRARHLGRRRPACHPHRHALGHPLDRRLGDPALLLVESRAAVAQRQLVEPRPTPPRRRAPAPAAAAPPAAPGHGARSPTRRPARRTARPPPPMPLAESCSRILPRRSGCRIGRQLTPMCTNAH